MGSRGDPCIAIGHEGDGVEQHVGLVAFVRPNGIVREPHQTSVCRDCYLRQFAQVYPGEPLPDIE